MSNLSQLVIDLEDQRKQAKNDLDRLDAAIATLRKRRATPKFLAQAIPGFGSAEDHRFSTRWT